MSAEDEKDGGTPEPKTYSEEEMTAAITGAKKEGASDSYSHFQSVADKQVADAKSTGSARESELTETIRTLKAAHLETLSPEERQTAMIEELYKDRVGDKPSAPAPDSPAAKDAPAASGNEDDMRKAIGTALESYGLDPGKVNWGDGKNGAADLKSFIGSVVDQVKAEKGGDEKDDDSDDGKKSENNVDITRGAGKATDVTQVDPLELVTSDKWEPVRGVMEG